LEYYSFNLERSLEEFCKVHMKLNNLSLLLISILGLAAICSVSAQQIVPSAAWERFYQNSACTFGSVAQTADGGYILGGNINDISGVAPSHTILLKVATQGDIQWEKSYGDSVQITVRQTTDGGYVFTATSDSPPSGNQQSPRFGQEDAWVVKLDAEGKIQWEKAFGGTGSDFAASIWQTMDGGYILAAYSDSPPSGNKEAVLFGGADGWVIKIDAQGNKQWDRSFGGESNDRFSSVRQTADGGYVLAGDSSSPPSGNKEAPLFGYSDSWVITLDTEGNKRWERSFGGTEPDFFLSADQTSDGGFLLGGGSSSPPSGNKEAVLFGARDYWIVKVDAAGNKQWDRSYRTPTSGGGVSFMRQTSDGGYALGGFSQVLKIDPQGDRQWDQLFGKTNANNPAGQPYAVEVADLQQTKDGGYIVCGSIDYPNAGRPASGCVRSSWVAKLGNVVSNSGEVVVWKPDAGLVLESVDDLNIEWKSDQTEVLSIGASSAIAIVPASQQRYYRLRKTGPSNDSPSISIGALLKWPVAQNQTLEISSSKDGPWEAFSGEQGIIGETHYAIIPQNLRNHYFHTRKMN
jgi:hypothetical protein